MTATNGTLSEILRLARQQGMEEMREALAKAEDVIAADWRRCDPAVFGDGDELARLVSSAEDRARRIRETPLP